MTPDTRATSSLLRPLTRTVQVIAAVLAAIVIVLGLLFTAQIAFGTFSTSVPLQPDLESGPELGQDAVYAWVFFDSARVTHPDPPTVARVLRWIGYFLVAAVVLMGCVVAFLLSGRLRRGRPFSGFAGLWLLLLGLGAVITAVLSPALLLEATATVVGDLGLRTAEGAGFAAYEDTGGPAALRLDRAMSPGALLRHTNWLLAGVGGILVIVSFAFRRGAQLQRDTEGLV